MGESDIAAGTQKVIGSFAKRKNAKAFETGKTRQNISYAIFYPFSLTNVDYAKKIIAFNLKRVWKVIIYQITNEAVFSRARWNPIKRNQYNRVWLWKIYANICTGVSGLCYLWFNTTADYNPIKRKRWCETRHCLQGKWTICFGAKISKGYNVRVDRDK